MAVNKTITAVVKMIQNFFFFQNIMSNLSFKTSSIIARNSLIVKHFRQCVCDEKQFMVRQLPKKANYIKIK